MKACTQVLLENLMRVKLHGLPSTESFFSALSSLPRLITCREEVCAKYTDSKCLS